MVDSSRTKIGRQSFANHVGNIPSKLQFYWLDAGLTKDARRNQLK